MTACAYPSSLPGPMPGAFAPRGRRAASSTEGPLQQRARQRDDAGLASQYTYVYTPAEMLVWREWYRITLIDGRRWFAHALPGAGGMVPRVVRYRSVQQQLLGAGLYRVSASFEQRGASLLPVDDGDPLWQYVVLLLQGGDLTDHSSYGRTASATGVTEDITSWQPASLPGFQVTNGLVTWPSSPELIPGAVDFCLEGWFRTEDPFVANGAYFWVPSSWGIAPTNNVLGAGTLTTMVTGTPLDGLSTITALQPYYVCMERAGANLVASINGAIVHTYDIGSGNSMPATPGPFCLGGRDVTPSIVLLCAGLRYTVGANRYGGASFTPPAAPYLVG